MALRITTELLGDHPRLSEIATELPLTASWIRGADGFIAFGTYKTHSVQGKKRFADASAWWQNELSQLEIKNNVHGVGTGPILFTSFAFSDDQPSILAIPQIVAVQKNGRSWVTWIGGEQPELSKRTIEKSGLALTWKQGALSDTEWSAAVNESVARIKRGDLEKVVLARDLIADSDVEIDPAALIQSLETEYPSTWLFLVDNLIGATPELLVRLSKSLVTSRVLAGTIRRTGDEDRDFALAGSLAKSSKDLEEHEYAVRSVAEALEPFASSTNVPDAPFVLHLPNVMHLATDVTGVINDSASKVDIFKLIAALHPSAAVCGTPTEVARDLIGELESMNRGRYAGPVGWVDAHGDGEMGIALRCGEIAENRQSIRIFAGCGIVAGSSADQELAESQAKLLPIRSALTRL
ncbi:MAG TPA: isochorismate synthase [Candidatus Nanopelagicaceae bacterium]